MADKIRVLLADDSIVFRLPLIKELEAFKEIEIVDTAANALDANQKIQRYVPDVAVVSADMPGMNKLEYMGQLVNKKTSIIVISSEPLSASEAIAAGASDYIKKTVGTSDTEIRHFASALVAVIRHTRIKGGKPVVPKAGIETIKPISVTGTPRKDAIIALGASTGGTDALIEVVKRFPKNTPPVVIVQHMPPVFTKMYAERLNRICAMDCKEAEDGDRLEEGQIIVGAGEYHLTLAKDSRGYYVNSKKGARVSGHCPSVDVLFESVAKTAGADAVGAILTGMGADGAEGLLKMRKAGAYTIGQDEATCVVYGMPCVAYKIGAVTKQLPIDKIAEEILLKVR